MFQHNFLRKLVQVVIDEGTYKKECVEVGQQALIALTVNIKTPPTNNCTGTGAAQLKATGGTIDLTAPQCSKSDTTLKYTTDAVITPGEYKLNSITLGVDDGQGDIEPALPDPITKKLTVVAATLVPASTGQTASQTIDYSKEGDYTFTIVFDKGITKETCPKATVGDKEIACDSVKDQTATYKLTKDEIAASTTAYPVKIMTGCKEAHDPKINLTITNGGGDKPASGAGINTLSKITFGVISLLLL